MNFVVITADIIDSRNYTQIGETLKPKLTQLTMPELLTPFTLSRGDELQALCRPTSNLPVLLRHLRFVCLPYQLRIGVGIGTVEAGPPTANSWEMNGPAFFKARAALDQLVLEKSPRTVWEGDSAEFSLFFNTIYLFVDQIMSGWTTVQWEAVQAYEHTGTYQKAAQQFHISWQSVRKRCQAAKWELIGSAERNMMDLLDKLLVNRV